MAHLIFENDKYILRDEWHVEDIISEAQNMECAITDEQAIQVMSLISHEYDANFGVNWDIVQNAILHICVRNET